MNLRSNVAEFKRLDRAIVQGEADVEAAKWEQARLAFEATALDGGLRQEEYAEKVGKSQSHISKLARMWGRVDAKYAQGTKLPNFAASYQEIKGGKPRPQQAARQVLATASDEQLDELLDDPVIKHRLKEKVDEDEKKRAARRKKARTQAKADPAAKVIREVVEKMDLYSRGLDLMAEEWIYALEDLSPELKAKVAKAAGRLEAAAHRMVEATKGRRSLRAVR